MSYPTIRRWLEVKRFTPEFVPVDKLTGPRGGSPSAPVRKPGSKIPPGKRTSSNVRACSAPCAKCPFPTRTVVPLMSPSWWTWRRSHRFDGSKRSPATRLRSAVELSGLPSIKRQRRRCLSSKMQQNEFKDGAKRRRAPKDHPDGQAMAASGPEDSTWESLNPGLVRSPHVRPGGPAYSAARRRRHRPPAMARLDVSASGGVAWEGVVDGAHGVRPYALGLQDVLDRLSTVLAIVAALLEAACPAPWARR